MTCDCFTCWTTTHWYYGVGGSLIGMSLLWLADRWISRRSRT